MKKILSVLLTIALVATFVLSVCAADTPTGSSDDVTVTVNVTEKTNYVFAFNFEGLDFVYNVKKNWNGEEYSAETTGWENDEATISVTNKSNGAVNVTFRYEAGTPLAGMTGAGFKVGEAIEDSMDPIALVSALAAEGNKTATATFKVAGSFTSETAPNETKTIGQVVVEITAG